jgi:hypothetical protein
MFIGSTPERPRGPAEDGHPPKGGGLRGLVVVTHQNSEEITRLEFGSNFLTILIDNNIIKVLNF